MLLLTMNRIVVAKYLKSLLW